MTTSTRLCALIAATSLAVLAPAAAHATQVQDAAGDVTGVNGAKPSNTPGFRAQVPSVDITKVKAQKVGQKVVVTVDVVDLRDVEDGTGPLVHVDVDHNGTGAFGAVGSYYTVDNFLSDAGVQSECGATGTKDVIANRVTVTFPKKCFPKATKVTEVSILTAGYDGASRDLPSDTATITRDFSLKTKKK